jgi:hypothetical protein
MLDHGDLQNMGELKYHFHVDTTDSSIYFDRSPRASATVGRFRGSNDNNRSSKSIPN